MRRHPPFGNHLVYLATPHRGKQDKCGRVCLGKEEGSRPSEACGCGCPSGSFPKVGRWAREHLQCGDGDLWLRNLHACLPRAPPGLLERRLIQFLHWGMEAARDLRQPALSSVDSGVWESLLHDSTSLKLLMQRIKGEVLRRGLGVVGNIPIPADIWERHVPGSFDSVASCRFFGVGPPSDEAVIMLRARKSQNLLFPFPPGSPGPNGGVFRHS